MPGAAMTPHREPHIHDTIPSHPRRPRAGRGPLPRRRVRGRDRWSRVGPDIRTDTFGRADRSRSHCRTERQLRPVDRTLVGGVAITVGPDRSDDHGDARPPPPPPAPPATSETMIVRAYFVLGGEPGTAGLVPVLREVPRSTAVAK